MGSLETATETTTKLSLVPQSSAKTSEPSPSRLLLLRVPDQGPYCCSEVHRSPVLCVQDGETDPTPFFTGPDAQVEHIFDFKAYHDLFIESIIWFTLLLSKNY